ncbi:MAG: hypothetical protein GXP46_07120, partial [Deferribacteres bacterium]|nr:hypothetical protein [Deferribacteres bacterium]
NAFDPYSYNGGLRIRINGSGFNTFNFGETEYSGRGVSIGPDTKGSLEVTRKIYVPDDDSFVRYLEIVENKGDTDVNAEITIYSYPDDSSSNETHLTGTSSGDTEFTTDDRYIISDDADGTGGRPAIVHVFAGEGAQAGITDAGYNDYWYYDDYDEIHYTFNLTVPARSRVIIMHFASQNATRADAVSSAEHLYCLQGSALKGLTQDELDDIVNFIPVTDSDCDGLNDEQEGTLGTDPHNPDTDGGGRTDYQEVSLDGTDPLDAADDEVPIIISGGINPSGQVDAAMDSGGNLHVVWVSDPGTGNNGVFYTMLAPDGSTLIDDTQVSNSASDAAWPSLTVDSQGKVHIAWVDRITSYPLWYTVLDPSLDDQDGSSADEGVITLVDDRIVSSSDTEKTRPDLAADSTGRVHIVWAEWSFAGESGKQLRVHHSVIASTGQVEAADHTVFTATTSQWDPAYPQIAVDNQDNAHIVWLTYDTNYDLRVHYKMLDGNGQTLIDTSALSPAGLVQAGYPSVIAGVNAAGDTEIVVTYAGSRTWIAPEELFVMNINPYNAPLDGSPADPSVIITGGPVSVAENVFGPSLFTDTAGNSLIAWYGGNVRWAPGHVYFRSIAPDGSISVPQRQLTDNPTATAYGELTRPAVLGGPDSTYILWTDNRTGTESVLLRRIK